MECSKIIENRVADL